MENNANSINKFKPVDKVWVGRAMNCRYKLLPEYYYRHKFAVSFCAAKDGFAKTNYCNQIMEILRQHIISRLGNNTGGLDEVLASFKHLAAKRSEQLLMQGEVCRYVYC